jgi:beta-glucanase (GH16 family)
MKIRIGLILLIAVLFAGAAAAQSDKTQAATKAASDNSDQNQVFDSVPVFADEFNYTGLPDPNKWGYDIGGSGWGNNELQYYTNQLKNAFVANGKLTITAYKEEMEGRNYTSARLITKNKGDIKYGRIEVRAQLPAGLGTWPAIWMLPTDWVYGGWPSSGEIDIMEHVGYDQDMIHITTHSEKYYFKINTQKSATKKIENASTQYHVYRLDWTPEKITGYIDNELIFTNVNEGTDYKAWPFDQRFHLLLNIAVGGDWGGAKGIDENVFPASMLVDYVRFYKMIEK